MTETVRSPALRVYIDRVEVVAPYRVLSFRASFGYDQRVSQAEIVLTAVPAGAHPFSTVHVMAGADPCQIRTRFAGYLMEFAPVLYPRGVTLICQGPLGQAALAGNPTPDGTDLSAAGVGQTDEAMITQVLSILGITDGQDIQGTGKVLGTIADTQFQWDEGRAGVEIINRLDEICLGYRTFDTPAGTIMRHQITATPAGDPSFTYTEGVDILEGSLRNTIIQARNRVHVSGFDDGSGAVDYSAEQPNPYVPSNLGHLALEKSSTMIEKSLTADAGDGLSCQEVANWLLGEVNRALYRIVFRTPRDELLIPSMTIKIVSPDRLGLSQNVWLQGYTVEIAPDGAFTQELVCIGGTGVSLPTPKVPVADFRLVLERDTAVVASAEVTRYVVTCEDLSVARNGSIASRAWAITSPGTPASGTDTHFGAILSTLAGKSVTLTITDSNGLTAAITKTCDLDVSLIKTRLVALAGQYAAEWFDGDSWNTYREDDVQAIVDVVPNNSQWGAQLDVIRSDDGLQASIAESTPFVGPATVTALYANVLVSPTRLLAGSDDGHVAISTDAGATWTVAAARPNASNWIRRLWYNPGQQTQILALTDNGLYRSDTNGATWVTERAAAGGETFNDFVVGTCRCLIAMSGGRKLISRDNVTQTFSAAVGNVLAVAADIQEDRFYAYDAAGLTWYTDANESINLVQRATLPATGATRGLVADPQARGVLYVCCFSGGVFKSVDGFYSTGGYLKVREPGVGTSNAASSYHQAGLHPVYNPDPTQNGSVYVGASGTGVGLLRRRSGGSWENVNGGLEDVYLMASPQGYPAILFVVALNTGSKRLYRSTDTGANWTDITPPFDPAYINWLSCEDNNNQHVYAMVNAGGAVGDKGLWRSANQGTSWTRIENYSDFDGNHWKSGGTRVWFTARTGAGKSIHYTDNDGGATTDLTLAGIDTDDWRIVGLRDHADLAYLLKPDDTADVALWRISDVPAKVSIALSDPDLSVNHPLWIRGRGDGLALLIQQDGASTTGKLYRSPDFGATWAAILGPGASFTNGGIGGYYQMIDYDPVNTLRWYFAGGGTTLFSSADDGLSWSAESLAAYTGGGATLRAVMVTG